MEHLGHLWHLLESRQRFPALATMLFCPARALPELQTPTVIARPGPREESHQDA